MARRKGRKTLVTSLFRVNGAGPVVGRKSRHRGGTRAVTRRQVGAESSKTAWSKWFGNPRKKLWFF
jgi:hypothetical protein